MEIMFLDFLQSVRSGFLDSAMKFLSFLGNGGWIWIVSVLMLLCFKKTRKSGIYAASALLLEFILCNLILKNIFARPRPYAVNPEITLLIPPLSDFSFPSGHAGSSFAVAASLGFSGSGFFLPAVILAVGISFSRMYLYVHYPTDVLAGALLGIFSAWLSAAVLRNAAKFKK